MARAVAGIAGLRSTLGSFRQVTSQGVRKALAALCTNLN